MRARTKVLLKHMAAVGAAAPAIVALGPLAAVVLPFWWRKAAKDGVRAALEDEMRDGGVPEQLECENRARIGEWYAERSDDNFEITSSITRTRKHPIFGVNGSYTMSRTDYSRR